MEYNKYVVGVPFEAIDNCTHDFIVGMDIFHKLGLGVSGLDFPGKDANTLLEPLEDVKPSLIPRLLPKEEKQAAFQKLKALFLAIVQQSLEENGQIPKSSHCPVPEMRVFLPVKEGTTVFQGQEIMQKNNKAFLRRQWKDGSNMTSLPLYL